MPSLPALQAAPPTQRGTDKPPKGPHAADGIQAPKPAEEPKARKASTAGGSKGRKSKSAAAATADVMDGPAKISGAGAGPQDIDVIVAAPRKASARGSAGKAARKANSGTQAAVAVTKPAASESIAAEPKPGAPLASAGSKLPLMCPAVPGVNQKAAQKVQLASNATDGGEADHSTAAVAGSGKPDGGLPSQNQSKAFEDDGHGGAVEVHMQGGDEGTGTDAPAGKCGFKPPVAVAGTDDGGGGPAGMGVQPVADVAAGAAAAVVAVAASHLSPAGNVPAGTAAAVAASAPGSGVKRSGLMTAGGLPRPGLAPATGLRVRGHACCHVCGESYLLAGWAWHTSQT